MSVSRQTYVATVGPEGMIGTTLALGSESVDHRAIVQVPGEALQVPSKEC